jgi:hypothetical protein
MVSSSGPRKVKVVSNSVFNGNWGFGTTDMFLDRSQMLTRNIGLVQDSTLKGKFLSDPEFDFTLEAYANDTHAPNILPKESNRVLQSIIDS